MPQLAVAFDTSSRTRRPRGICAAVCPRGVLKLENGKTIKDRFDGAGHPMSDLNKSLQTE